MRRRSPTATTASAWSADALLIALAAAAAALAVPADATHPGSNGKLLFERPTGNGGNLFSVATDGSGLTRLTKLKGVAGDSSWSPDGSRIAFVRARNPSRGPYEIWAMNPDGSGLSQLTRHRGFSIAPAWSPDGTKIVYATDTGAEHLRLYVMNADGPASKAHTEPQGSELLGSSVVTRRRHHRIRDPQERGHAVPSTAVDANVPDPTGALVTRWGADPLAFGSYSYVAAGASLDDYETLADPVSDRLLFAGEATNPEFFATVNGAYQSGCGRRTGSSRAS